jgi:hypothetical protein
MKYIVIMIDKLDWMAKVWSNRFLVLIAWMQNWKPLSIVVIAIDWVWSCERNWVCQNCENERLRIDKSDVELIENWPTFEVEKLQIRETKVTIKGVTIVEEWRFFNLRDRIRIIRMLKIRYWVEPWVKSPFELKNVCNILGWRRW